MLNRSIKSLDDLAKVSNELVGQLFHSQTKTAPPAAASPSDPPPPASPVAAAKKQCANPLNIDEFIKKTKEEFPNQLKDCSFQVAKNLAIDAAPVPDFLKKAAKSGEKKEPKEFMMQCTMNGIEKELSKGFPGADKYIKSIEKFMQNILNGVSTNGKLDPVKLTKAVNGMDIGDLLDNIRKQAANDNCVVQGPSEESPGEPSEAYPKSIIPGGNLIDSRDGKTYKTIIIGDQTWMTENLNYAVKGSKCYNNNSANCNKYGRLYNWATAIRACPAGWHIPSNAEWEKLTTLEEIGWNAFAALPSGYGYSDGNFYDVGYDGNWWSATEENSIYAKSRNMNYLNSYANRGYDEKSSLFSVRCVQD